MNVGNGASAVQPIWIDLRRRGKTPTGKERYVEALFAGLVECGAKPTAIVYSDGISVPEEVAPAGHYEVVAIAADWRFHGRLCYKSWLRVPTPIVISGIGFTPALYSRRCIPIIYDSAAWVIPTTPARVRCLETVLRPTALRRHVVFAISSATEREVAATGRRTDRITVLPPPLSAYWREVPRRPYDQRSGIVCVGTLNGRKRSYLAIQAYAAMATDEPLVIIGADGGELGALLELAGRLGVLDRVQFRGAVEDGDVREAYATAKVFLNTSEYEGLCLPALEAMSAGLPVISTPIEPLREWLSPASFADATPAHLAPALRTVMESRVLWEDRVSDGLRRVDSLSPRTTAEYLLDVMAGSG
jgi:glycosyltransferase involved in cell wall biosynthesis